ncbi:hypothetical protein MTO96_000527 [Rhipicephalus appendiculatus]
MLSFQMPKRMHGKHGVKPLRLDSFVMQTTSTVVSVDDAVWVTEELHDSAIVREVGAEACPEAPSSDEDSDDDVSPPAPIGSATANEYITALKDLEFSRGLPEEHARQQQAELAQQEWTQMQQVAQQQLQLQQSQAQDDEDEY